MKIIVLCKAVAVGVSDVKIATGGKALQYQSQLLAMNECDEYALEEAIVLKRAHGGEVTVLTMGSITTQNILHLALAKGADRVVQNDACRKFRIRRRQASFWRRRWGNWNTTLF